MPSQVLHILFGEDVIDGLYLRLKDNRNFTLLADRAVEKIKSAYWCVFVLGCQGPDIFYHNRKTKPVALEYGSLLHRRGYGIFSATLLKMGLPDPPPAEDDIRSNRGINGINALGVYALGFMTHAILDRFCHPYIIFKSVDLQAENLSESRIYHPFFERIIDVLMLEKLRRQKITEWDQGILAKTCENPPPGLKELIGRALTAAFPEKTKRDGNLSRRIDNAFADSGYYYRLSDPLQIYMAARLGREFPISHDVLPLVFPEKLTAAIDFLNIRQEPWYYPWKPDGSAAEPDTRSFLQVYADAIKAATDALEPCMVQYLASGIFPITGAAQSIGNGCLSIHDREGKPCAPNLTSALPLGGVLEEQRRMRCKKIPV